MKFFYAPGTVAMASLIALYEVDADFEPIRLNFQKSEQTKPEYLAINPKGRVPALITKDGILTETPAILIYLGETYPAANLIPSDPFERAKMHEMLSYLASTVHVNHAHKMRGHRWVDQKSSIDDMQSKVTDNMYNSFQLIENELNKGPWLIGNQYTVADAHMFAITSWLEGDGVPISNLPNVAKHFAAMQKRAAVIKAMETNS